MARKKKNKELEEHKEIYLHVKKDTVKVFFIGLLNMGISFAMFFIGYCIAILTEYVPMDNLSGPESLGFLIVSLLTITLFMGAVFRLVTSSVLILFCWTDFVKEAIEERYVNSMVLLY